jgi:acylpyruvate hydrolase
MRVVTYRTAQGTRAGRLDGDVVVPVDARDVGALLALGEEWTEVAGRDAGDALPLAEVDLAPVVPNPSKIICVGHNYRSHIEEVGAKYPEVPALFAKFARSLIGARDNLILPAVSDMVDWEVELTVVIGRPVRNGDVAQATAAIAGYTVGNDVSVRDFQKRTAQWLAGKTFESSTPVGPALVTPDEVDSARDLKVRTLVDDRVVQDSSTADLLFSPADIVAFASQVITLDPGDLILTGTPSGVGIGRKPPEYLREGQVLTTEIEGLGACVNRCVRAT